MKNFNSLNELNEFLKLNDIDTIISTLSPGFTFGDIVVYEFSIASSSELVFLDEVDMETISISLNDKVVSFKTLS
jgi:hypothetical protein